MSVSIPEGSTEFLLFDVTAAQTILTDQPVFVAASKTKPATGDWTPGEWIGEPGRKRTFRWLIPAVPRGFYDLYVRLDAAPEAPVIKAGSLSIH